MAQLRVHKDEENGEPKVECPSCGELVSPEKNPILDSYDCECGAVMELSTMKAYAKARKAWLDELERGSWDE